ncbi:MAG: glycosyltransferase family 2 protein, partial [Faecousia sp.]
MIVPVYNGAEFLRPCVDSILAQSFRDLELILVDDGST